MGQRLSLVLFVNTEEQEVAENAPFPQKVVKKKQNIAKYESGG